MDDHRSQSRSLSPAPLMEAALMLARHKAYGLVWADSDLVVTARFGQLTDGIEVGAPLMRALPALVGMEADIAALREEDGALGLPSISMRRAGEAAPKVHLAVYRHGADGGSLVLIGRALESSDAEVEVMRQMRLRLITEAELAQKKLELERTNAELALCNRDLEDFASVISHDLKAPMRGIGHLCDDIETAFDGGDPARVRTALTELRAQTRRLSRMLVDLLDYASLGRSQDMLSDIDTGRLIADISESLPRPDGIVVEIAGSWPQVRTYAAPLDLVIRNLLDNAIKHHDRNNGRIVLSAETSPAALSIRIADDGPGIPRRHQDAVFLPFKRVMREGLPSGPETSTGMGLAFVKRTVETVGGRLSLHSDPEIARGTTFVIDWPIAPAAAERRLAEHGGI